jgi:hypothetical protein
MTTEQRMLKLFWEGQNASKDHRRGIEIRDYALVKSALEREIKAEAEFSRL